MRIDSLLPSWIARRLAGRDTMQRAVDNAFWLFLDQVVRMGLALFTGVWIARYLGPEQYGWLSYAGTIVGLVSSLTLLGISPIVVRELAKDPEKSAEWVGAAVFLKSAAAIIGFLACVVIAYAHVPPAAAVRPLIMITAVGLLFQVLDVSSWVFQARGAAKIAGWVSMGAAVPAAMVKAALILAEASIFAIAAASVLELALGAVGWVLMRRRSGVDRCRLLGSGEKMSLLLREGWAPTLSGLAVYAQAYVDQLVIGNFLGAAALGQYSAAMRLVVAFGFVPMVICTISSPEITRAKRDDVSLYRRRLWNLYRLLNGAFVVAASLLLLVGTFAAERVLGVAYREAAVLLPWLALRLFFTNFIVARAIFLNNEGLFRFGLITAVTGAVSNLLLNLWLIPRFGIPGAIAASLLSLGVSTFLLDLFHPRARINLGWMLRAIFMPWRPLAP